MSIYDNRVCRECGRVFSGGPRAWYCPECRAERTRQRDREHKRRRNNPAAVRKLGSTDICQNCGKPYTVSAGQQKYCPDCKAEMYRALDNAQGIAYYKNMDENAREHRNELRRKRYPEINDKLNAVRRDKRKKTCRHCGGDMPDNKYTFCENCRAEMLKIYDETHSLKKITDIYGCSDTYIYSIIRKQNRGL